MNVIHARDLVNSLTVRPNYKIHADESWMPGMLDITIECKTFDSSNPPNFPRAITIAPTGQIYVGKMVNDKELLAQVFQLIMRMEAHEWQEFLRLDSAHGYEAPFHPHTVNGQAAAMAYGALV